MQTSTVLALFSISLSATVCCVFGQSCPGSQVPAINAVLTSLMKRASSLGYVPTESQVNSAANVQRVKRVLPKDKFKYVFPLANKGNGPESPPYNYENFLKAVAMFPDLCNSASGSNNLDKVCLLELAILFANFIQETGAHDPSSTYPPWRQGLYYYNEMGCPEGGASCLYCQAENKVYPCVPGQYYFGRGPFQLSYNYNYGYFSLIVYKNSSVLLYNPGKVVNGDTAWLAFASAIWFYMTPQSPKPSMHDVATGWWIPNAADVAAGRLPGLGVETMIINGAVECKGGSESKESLHRQEYFKSLSEYFGVSNNTNLGCAKMKPFDSSSSAFVTANWDQDWSAKCKCKLVSYNTPNTIYDDPNPQVPYQRCLDLNFPSNSGANATNCSALKSCKSGCSKCKYVPECAAQAATDADCAPCAKGQSWWPCNVEACYCKD